MKSFFHSRIFWVGLVGVTVAAGVLAYNLLPKAMKVINVDLKVSRKEVLEKAAHLAKKYQWTPEKYHTAVSFQNDSETQLFAELECGGTETFLDIIKSHIYEPYTWKVRHFQEQVTHETLMSFTPDGTPYEFLIKLPENEKVEKNLSAQEARKLAEQEASKNWNIDFSVYKPFEDTHDTKPGGRVDHTFVYQREDQQLGKEGRYRVELQVGGDKVTSVNHKVHIPESFKRRYQEMRSGNEGIAHGAHLVYLLLYLLLGGVIGGFLLFRKKQLIVKQAFFWALLIASLYIAMELNQLPVLWMKYNTAMPMNTFLFSLLSKLIASFITVFCTLFIAFSVGESLTRKAFGHFPQLWKSWSGTNAASPTIAGYTFGGYCGAIMKLAWASCTYLFLTTQWGWWAPGATLTDPNTIANYIPSLNGVALSLFAGFNEECMFRAIPLAGAALLGRRFKKEKLFIGIAFILQAFVFAACHANYTTYPAYFRVVELLPGSLIFGLLYLSFGLLPVIIMHWIYDLILMSLPVFVSQAEGIWIHKLITVFFALVPVWIIVYQRYRAGKWKKLAQNMYNAAWKSKELEQDSQIKQETKSITVPASLSRGFLCAGLIGLGCWFFFGNFINENKQLRMTKQEAQEKALAIMQQTNPAFLENVKMMAMVGKPNETQVPFVWQELGKEWYHTLQNKNYLQNYHWIVRFVHFDGDLAQRAEEYIITFYESFEKPMIQHILPEQKAGAQLTKEQAQEKVIPFLEQHYKCKKEALKELTAQAQQKPQRRDWIFTFQDTSIDLPKGSARIIVTVAGDEITGHMQQVHVPEDWQRQEEERKTKRTAAASLCQILFILLCLLGVATLVNSVMQCTSIKTFFLVSTGFLGISLISLMLMLPLFIFQFKTAQPFGIQLITTLMQHTFQIIPRALFFGLFLCLCFIAHRAWQFTSKKAAIIIGYSSGIVLYACYTLLQWYTPSLVPVVGDAQVTATLSPFVQTILYAVSFFVRYTALLYLLCHLCNVITEEWTKKKWIGTLFITVTTTATMGFLSVQSIESLFLQGIAMGVLFAILYQTTLYKDLSLLPLLSGSCFILHLLEQGLLNPYPTALLNQLVGIIIVFGASFYWFILIRKKEIRKA